VDEAIRRRWADAADFEPVLDLSSQLARHIEEGVPPLTSEAFCASHIGPEAPMKLLVAEKGGVVVGLAAWTLVHELYSAEAGLYLSDLAVDRAVRGQGVGKALIEGVKAWARDHGVRKLGWDVWHANHTAKRFYEAVGATRSEETHPYKLSLKDALPPMSSDAGFRNRVD